MSPGKRRREVEETQDLEIEAASSSLRASHQKRPRVSTADEPLSDSSMTDHRTEDEDSLTMDEGTPESDAPEMSEVDPEEQEEDDDDDEDVSEIRATQFIQKNRRQHKDNIAAEQGIIEEVFCRNFMCHTKLRIRLGPLINFIIGHNGSGKSAVLTALTMCLGGKATATNRGANLKSLIKEGTDNATLAVKIKNQGDNAYKPELYGESITVERHFNRSGTSGFKIKNAEDKIITTRKADLDDILDFFAFQLDNPINVLTQDMARQFLSNSSPADKYKFFIRGTQLETLNGDYKLIEEHQNNMEEKLLLREDDVKVLEAKAKEAEAKKKRLDATQTIRDKIAKYERMHAWAQVEEQERKLEERIQQVAHAEQNVREKEAAAEDISGVFEGHNQAWEAAKSTIETLKEPLVELEDKFAQAKEHFNSNTKEVMSVQAEQRTIRENLKKHKEDAKRLQKEISQEQKLLDEAQGDAHAQRLEELEALKQAAEQAKQEHNEHKTEFADLERAREQAAENYEEANGKIAHAKEELDRARSRLNNLQREQGRKFAGFPDRMEQIVDEINRETRWRSKPVGPLGLHVKLLKPEWASVIETTLGRSLDGFAVTNTEDQRLLTQLFKRRNFEATIFNNSPHPLDTSDKEPLEDVDTILRVLRIENDLVRNVLVINHAIDQTVLIKGQDEANEYMYGGQAGFRRRNVKATVAMGNRPGTGTRYDYSRAGQKSGPVRAWTGPAARMQVDREEQIRMQQDRLQVAQSEWQAVEQERRSRQTELTQAKQAQVRWKRREDDLRVASQRADDAVEEKNNEIESNRPQDGRLQELERQLEEAKGERESAESSFQDSVIAKDRLDGIARERKAEMDQAKNELDEAQKRLEKAQRRVLRLETDRHAALLEKNEAVAMIESSKTAVERCLTMQQRQQEIVDDYIRQASEISDRVPVEPGITCDALDERVARLNKDYEAAERDAGGTREELTRAWAKARGEYVQAKKGLIDMKRLEKKLKQTLNERQRRWTLFRKFISVRAKINFHYLLSERSFRGRVILDHAAKLLDISVEPDISKTSDAGRQAKTLSGGEKSFSTICLLLSIWEAIGSPIRCLDEFDVFMDSVNRATSMTMMIQAARRAVGKQFVLITPQAMNNVEMGDDVRVHRMSDPERGQTTLSFAATQA